MQNSSWLPFAIFQNLCKIQSDCHFSEPVQNTASWLPFFRICAKYSKPSAISQGMCEIQQADSHFSGYVWNTKQEAFFFCETNTGVATAPAVKSFLSLLMFCQREWPPKKWCGIIVIWDLHAKNRIWWNMMQNMVVGKVDWLLCVLKRSDFYWCLCSAP